MSTSLSGNYPAGIFATTSVDQVFLFSRFNSAVPSNGAVFPTENFDRTTGAGTLTLVLTYADVPEPASLLLLTAGLLGLATTKRTARLRR
ncbi:MAG: hypothetical protein NVSMB18_35480 [Acetobacteraceae bacterium]